MKKPSWTPIVLMIIISIMLTTYSAFVACNVPKSPTAKSTEYYSIDFNTGYRDYYVGGMHYQIITDRGIYVINVTLDSLKVANLKTQTK